MPALDTHIAYSRLFSDDNSFTLCKTGKIRDFLYSLRSNHALLATSTVAHELCEYPVSYIFLCMAIPTYIPHSSHLLASAQCASIHLLSWDSHVA